VDLLQIVPALPPAAEGLGGYALALAERLAPLIRGEIGFAVGDPAWRPPPAISGVPEASAVPVREPAALLDLLEAWRRTRSGRPCAVVLQYAGYGYQARGCPRWLVEGLEDWRRRRPGDRLVTFFHEVYASGLPWRSSFWLSPAQRRLAARLTRLSDATATSLDLYAAMLVRWRPRSAPAVLPVVSNVGEPPRVPPLAGRPPRLVVFGGAGNRSRVYRDHLPALAAACRELGAEEIADVGPPVPVPRAADGVPIVPRGLLPAAEASAALLQARAGFLAYPTAFLPKSGVFAALCAHGLATVCAAAPEPPRLPAPGVRAGEHYLSSPLFRPDSLQEVADAARAWYAGHSLDRHAAVFHERLLACAS
jgi:hypothetical protein